MNLIKNYGDATRIDRYAGEPQLLRALFTRLTLGAPVGPVGP